MYLITGANGHLGRAAVEILLQSVSADQIILTTRNPEALSKFADRGVEIRPADFSKPDGLESAFFGADRMLLISTANVGTRVQYHRNALEAARKAGVGYVAYTSIVGAGNPENDAVVCLEHRATEQLIRDSGLNWNSLRDSQYAEAVAYYVIPGAIAEGQLVGSWGEGKVGFVSREDCAAAAVGALLGRGEDNRPYDITGPEELTYQEVSVLAASVSGSPIDYLQISDAEQYAFFDSIGVPREYQPDMSASPIPWNSDDMVSFSRAIRQGKMSSLSDAVAILTGRQPRSMRSILEEASASWPSPSKAPRSTM